MVTILILSIEIREDAEVFLDDIRWFILESAGEIYYDAKRESRMGKRA